MRSFCPEVPVTKLEKCAHPSCDCMVADKGEFGAYCSAHCQDAKQLNELRCECGHAQCAKPAVRTA